MSEPGTDPTLIADQLISLRDCSFRYRRRAQAAVSLSLCISTKSTVVLGENGAGKSTLIELMAGGLTPTAGQVCRLARVARVPQRPVRLRGMTALDQTMYAAWLGGCPVAHCRERALEVLGTVGLDRLGGRPPRSLSGGQQARLAIAGALVTRPEVLLLDEPNASLDPVARHELREVLCELVSAGVTIVTASHSGIDVGAPYERALVLVDGRLVFDGSLSELRTSRSHPPDVRRLVDALAREQW